MSRRKKNLEEIRKQKRKKRITLAVIAVIALVIVFALVYHVFGPVGVSGVKTYTLEVVDADGETTVYEGETETEYLRELLDELQETEDFSYEGEDSDYGIYITTINGVTADYDADGAYWSIYVDGEFGDYGADYQPIEDGVTYSLIYEIFE